MFSETVVPGYYKDIYPAIDPSNFSRKEFEEKVVVVTGSGSGIGKETALAFSRLGAKVAFTDLKLDSAQRAADEAKQYGNPTLAMAGDVRKLDDMVELVHTVSSTFGEVDIIVFAAGYGMFDKFVISKVEDWWGVIETNLKGPTDLTRLVLPSMVQRNTGKLIYISSRAAVMEHPFSTAYSVSKTGLIRFVGCLQGELNDTNVQAFAVNPGSVRGTQLGNIDYVIKDYVRKEAPEVPATIQRIVIDNLSCSARLPAWTSVFLASGRAEALKGRYIDSTQDQLAIIDNIDEVEADEMYLLRARRFATIKANP